MLFRSGGIPPRDLPTVIGAVARVDIPFRRTIVALAVLPLIIVPLSPRLRDLRTELSWHAWQGFLLAIIETVVLVGVTALAAYATLSSVPAGVTLGVVAWALWVAVLLVHLGAIVAAIAVQVRDLQSLTQGIDRIAGIHHRLETAAGAGRPAALAGAGANLTDQRPSAPALVERV